MESLRLRQFSRHTPWVVDKSTDDGRGRGCQVKKPLNGGDKDSGSDQVPNRKVRGKHVRKIMEEKLKDRNLVPGLWQVTELPNSEGHNKGAREEGQLRGGDGKAMRGAPGRTKRPRR